MAASLAGGCAPSRVPPGPGPTEPRLAEDALVMADGTRLPLRRHLPPEGAATEAVLLALHGFNDRSASYDLAGPVFAQAGVAVYAYDHRGFGASEHAGLWPGLRVLAGDAAEAARLLRARHPGVPLYMIGESMGGAVAVLAATLPDLPGGPPPVDGTILSAPAVWARWTMPFYQRWALWISEHTVPWMRLKGDDLGFLPSDNLEMLRELGRDPLFIKKTRVDAVSGLVDLMGQALEAAPAFDVRALVLYGEKDEIVPWPPTEAFWKTLPDPGGRQRLALYPNGWHMLLRDLDREVVIDDVLAWMANPEAPLPSGNDLRALARLNEATAMD